LSEQERPLPYLSQPYNFTATAYHFSDNYDCSACGRVNQPHGIIINNWGKHWSEYCPACIWEIAPLDELNTWSKALSIIEKGMNK
jgi:hypothetical protein